MKKRGLDISLLDEAVDLLRQGRQLEERCRDHGLTLIDTGSHSDLFKK